MIREVDDTIALEVDTKGIDLGVEGVLRSGRTFESDVKYGFHGTVDVGSSRGVEVAPELLQSDCTKSRYRRGDVGSVNR